MRTDPRFFDVLSFYYGDDPEGDPNPEPTPEPETKTFTQEDLDKIVQKRVGKMKSQIETLTNQLKNLEQSKTLSEEEKRTLAEKLEELETQNLTVAEQAARKEKKLLEQHKKDVDKLSSESKLWQERFQSQVINNALISAANENDAQSVDQIRMMFGSCCFLTEEKDDSGEPTGNFVPMLRFNGKGEDDEITEFELPVREAITKIREDGLNSNLFKHRSTGGTGEPGQGKGKANDPTRRPSPEDFNGDTAKFYEAYSLWKQQQRDK